MMHPMKPPEQRHGMIEAVPPVRPEIEQHERAHHQGNPGEIKNVEQPDPVFCCGIGNHNGGSSEYQGKDHPIDRSDRQVSCSVPDPVSVLEEWRYALPGPEQGKGANHYKRLAEEGIEHGTFSLLRATSQQTTPFLLPLRTIHFVRGTPRIYFRLQRLVRLLTGLMQCTLPGVLFVGQLNVT